MLAIRLLSILSLLYYASELAPALAVLLCRSREPVHLRVALFGLTIFLIDMTTLAIDPAVKGNPWLDYLVHPIEVLMAMSILFGWQTTTRARRTIGWMVPVYLIAMIGLFGFVEASATFSFLIGPISGMVVLCVVIYTLVTRALHERGALRNRDWFWICCGLALYFGAEVGIEPTERLLTNPEAGQPLAILALKIVVESAGLLTMTRGLLLRTRGTAS